MTTDNIAKAVTTKSKTAHEIALKNLKNARRWIDVLATIDEGREDDPAWLVEERFMAREAIEHVKKAQNLVVMMAAARERVAAEKAAALANEGK